MSDRQQQAVALALAVADALVVGVDHAALGGDVAGEIREPFGGAQRAGPPGAGAGQEDAKRDRDAAERAHQWCVRLWRTARLLSTASARIPSTIVATQSAGCSAR